MKRLLSLALSAALLAALTLPAAAEEPEASAADARLAKVTQLVKDTLELDTALYETFRGGVSDQNGTTVWELNWEDNLRSLSATALEDGTIVSFYRWDYAPSAVSARCDFPVFPGGSGDTDRAAAEAFLARVLREGETVELKEDGSAAALERSGSWSSAVYLNGLPSHLNCYISVEEGVVKSFQRDVPESYAGGVPSPDASADPVKAAADLTGALALKLEYVQGGEEGRAVLRYVPEDTHTLYVDAKTGELIDLTELEKGLSRRYAAVSGSGADAAAPEAAADKNAFTDAEREGIRQMEGALSKETLDQSLRAVEAYGLRGYALSSASYEQDGESMTCTLRYGRVVGEDRHYRTFRVDAKTGAVQSIYSTSPWDREPALTEAQAREKAEAFLKVLCPDRTLAYYETPNYAWSEGQPFYRFRFARKSNGLFYPANAYSVSIDGADGSVYGLSFTWDEDVAFDSPEGAVRPEAALSAWAGTYETTLSYRLVPQAGDLEPVYGLRLTYGLEREGYWTGVDAKTGEALREDASSAREPLRYTDLAGSSAKADIEKLAGYGAGFASERFRPGKAITQAELAALLYSLRAPALDPENLSEDDRNAAYFEAYRMGALRLAERDDDAVLTRSQVVKMLLNAAGYGPAARLEGVFASDLRDFENQPAAERGYAAIAQALGMVSGSYAGTRSATRGEAASMLCRALERTV